MPLRDDLLEPIPGDNPSGNNLRYDPITDKIKEARREDLDVPQGQWKTALKTADYPQVIKLGGEVLASAKDLQIAVWLVDAHVRREGFALLERPSAFSTSFWSNTGTPSTRRSTKRTTLKFGQRPWSGWARSWANRSDLFRSSPAS